MDDASDKLARLLKAAEKDPSKEASAIVAMLDALVYAHIPLSDDSGRLRFIQFVRPDNGKTVLPVFTDRQKADEATGHTTGVIGMRGRELFALTLGATLMVDPNHRDCVLDPEELKTLLAYEVVGSARPYVKEPSERAQVVRPTRLPRKMTAALQSAYSRIPFVKAAYLAVVNWQSNLTESVLMIAVLLSNMDESDRVMRATVAAIQKFVEEPGMPIDVAMLDPADSDSPLISKGTCIFKPRYAADK